MGLSLYRENGTKVISWNFPVSYTHLDVYKRQLFMEIMYRQDAIPSAEQIIELYGLAGLPRPIHDLYRIKKIYANSNLVITAWHDQKLVGVARSITDFAWNDYFGPVIYLSTNREAWPISYALSTFNGIYGQQPQLIQAGALMTLVLPLILFAVAQRFFVQGIVVTGVDK